METGLRHNILPPLLLAMVNYQLAGHWPWDNKAGHEQDLHVGTDDDGEPIYLPASIIMPTLTRALRDNGTLGLYQLLAKGSPDVNGIVDNFGRAAANDVFSVVNSPALSAVMTGAAGKALYLHKGNDLLRTTDRAEENANGIAVTRLKSALLGSNSVVGGLSGHGHGAMGEIKNPALSYLTSPVFKALFGPSVIKDKPK